MNNIFCSTIDTYHAFYGCINHCMLTDIDGRAELQRFTCG